MSSEGGVDRRCLGHLGVGEAGALAGGRPELAKAEAEATEGHCTAEHRKVTRARAVERVGEHLDLVGTREHLSDGEANGNQWQSVAINGNQWQSVAISGNQWQSVGTREHLSYGEADGSDAAEPMRP